MMSAVFITGFLSDGEKPQLRTDRFRGTIVDADAQLVDLRETFAFYAINLSWQFSQ
jgi:hypothetical protein